MDVSSSMLAVARRHVGAHTPLHQGSFTTLELGQVFDVVSCLFSSICHAQTPAGLAEAVARMRALRPDGLLLVERYFSPQQWDDSRVGVHVEVGALTASQYHASRRHGPRADLHVHYVLAEPGSVIAHDEHFRVGLFTEQDYAAAFDAAGLCHRTLLPDALTGLGACTWPAAPPSPPGRTAVRGAATRSLPLETDLCTGRGSVRRASRCGTTSPRGRVRSASWPQPAQRQGSAGPFWSRSGR